MLDRSSILISMNQLDTATRARIIACLVEGNSIRATCRMTGAAKGTVLKLLADIGEACADYLDRNLRNLPCKRVQCDEIWSFCYAKEKNVPERMKDDPGVGSVWTWTAIDADTKLIVSHLIGSRDLKCRGGLGLQTSGGELKVTHYRVGWAGSQSPRTPTCAART